MKKTSSPGNRTASAKRSTSRPTVAQTCTRLEVTPSSALALLDVPAQNANPELRRVRFGYFKPEARDVHVVGSFNGWDPRATPLRRDALGDWSIEIGLPVGEHRYRFFVDGEWRDDPSAQQTARNPFGGFDAVMVVV